MLGQLRRAEDTALFRSTLFDRGESVDVRVAAGRALERLGGTLSAEDLRPFLAGLSQDDDEPGTALTYVLVSLTTDDAACELLAATFRRLARPNLQSALRWFGPKRFRLAEALRDLQCVPRLDRALLERAVDTLAGTPALAEATRDHPAVHDAAVSRLALPLTALVDALGEDGLLERLRTVLSDPSSDHRLSAAATRLLARLGSEGVRVAVEVLATPSPASMESLIDLLMRAAPDSLLARTRLQLESEREIEQVRAVLRLVARRPREVDRDLLMRAMRVPSLHTTAFRGLEALDRADPTWNERALALAGDHPTLRAQVHARRARGGDLASRDVLVEGATSWPCDARSVALQALSKLAPELRDLFRRTLVAPRQGCRPDNCENEPGAIAVRALTRDVTPEDLAFMVDAHLVGPWPLSLSAALDALWPAAPT